MATFAADAEQFVRQLVEQVFEVELASVVLAQAIEDATLRARLAEAERLADAGDADASFVASVAALAMARKRWQHQQEDAYGYMPDRGILDADPKWIDSSWQIDDYADVGVFCDDLGEYHWLLATRRQHGAGLPLQAEDAGRALSFCFAWILRWQRFDAAYPQRRWIDHWRLQQPPAITDGGPPSVLGLKVGDRVVLGDRERDRLHVTVADIPDLGRADWGDDLDGALRAAADAHGLEAGQLELGPHEPWLGQFTFLSAPGLPARPTLAAIEAAIAAVDDAYRARRTGVEARERSEAAAASAFLEVLRDVSPDLFASATAFHALRPHGEDIVVAVAITGDDAELSAVTAIFQGAGGRFANTTLEPDARMLVTYFELDADGKSLLRDTATAAADQVAHLRNHAAHIRDERARHQAEFDAARG